MKVEEAKKEMTARAVVRENEAIRVLERKIELLEQEKKIKSKTGVHSIEGKYVYDNDPEYQTLLVDLTMANLDDAINAIKGEIDKIKDHQLMRDMD